MPDILQLKEFAITRLHIDWHEPRVLVPQGQSIVEEVSFDYDVLRREDTPHSFALKLRVKCEPQGGKNETGFLIESEITGYFDFPESMNENEMQTLIRINGGTILYGILRGQIAAFTGSFPYGKFMLPAVYMPSVVEDIEKKREEKSHKRKLPKKAKSKPKKE